MHEAVARQADRTPDRVAIVCRGLPTTYRELVAAADGVTGRLRAAAVLPGDLVGVAVSRGPHLVPALLGVLGVGAAYVPLDPDHPSTRRDLVLADANARVLVTDEAAVAPADVDRVDVAAAVRAGADGRGRHVPEPDELAYVIHTSGSTGRPKGVMVGHGALRTFLGAMRRRPGLSPGTTLAAVTTVSFDIAALELYLPLLVGGTVALADRDEQRDPERLASLLASCGARVLQATPTTWQLLLDSGWVPPAGFTALCGGERLPAELAARIGATGADLWDLYGPTETTVWSSTARIANGTVIDFAPVDGDDLHVLAGADALVDGVGELYIGGAGLAHGYLGQPRLTADRFVPDPFGERPGARLYRSGDRARRHRSGRIEILGRTDEQVKIRGFRVEPGEIEAVLAGHPLVAAAVVRVVTPPGEEPALVAWWVPSGTTAGGDPEERLRAHCARALPAHMVPARVVAVAAFPTTPNGKIDRAALPDPGSRAERPGGRAATTPHERSVLRAYSAALGFGITDVDADFFRAGGHSLLAARVVTALRAEWGIALPVAAVFRARTAAALAAEVAAAPPASPLHRRDRARPLPLAPAQQRLWALHHIDPADTAYVEAFALPLPDTAGPAAVAAALTALVARHEALRTRYPAGPGGEPVQVIEQARPVELPGDPDRPAAAVVADELAVPFDLSAAPPVRLRRARLADGRPAVVVLAHHIATDDASQDVLADELAALLAGRDLPDHEIDVADLADVTTAAGGATPADEDVRYWVDRLAGLPQAGPLPNGTRTGDRTVVRTAFTIPATTADRLTALGRARGATPFAVLAAGFAETLARASGCRDTAVGVPVAGRSEPGAEHVVGLLVNTVVLRIDTAGGPSFAELVDRTAAAATGAFAHDALPFDRLVTELAPARTPGRHPLVDVLFAVHDAPRHVPLEVSGRTAKIDMSWHLTARADGGWDGHVEHPSALYDAATVAALVAAYTRLLAAADGRTRADRLPVAAEPTAAPPPGPEPAPVPTRIATVAATRPDAPAVLDGDAVLDHADLDAAAAALAGRLAELGVGRGDVVGVRLPRGTRLVVALLGVLRTGAAYLPLDPRHPTAHAAAILEDAGVRVVVTTVAARPATQAGIVVLALDDAAEQARIAASPPRAVADIHPGDPAYVVQTSGSTGRAKGVLVTHGGLARYVDWAVATLGPRPGEATPLHTSPAHDLALTALYPPLAAGSAVRPVDDGAGVDALAAQIAVGAAPVALLKMTPTHADLLTAILPARQLARAARVLVLGGEQLRGDRLAVWSRLAPDTVVVNSYGPAETTVACLAHVTTAGALRPGPVPIGQPLPGATAHVLDAMSQPVADGMAGELCVGGTGVALGYPGRPRATADRFVPDPWSRRPGATMYRTGDLVRRRGDGTTEFLGRVDDQLAVAGHRVEPGEIEAVLLARPDVAAAVVVGVPDADDDGRSAGAGTRLAAHVVPAGGRAPTAAELRAHLSARLPAHLVPSLWALTEELPMLANGKIDRQALPRAAAAPTAAEEPRTPAEKAIGQVWADVLGAGPVGPHDDFFALGGQSVLATRIAARVRDRFGVAVGAADVLGAGTVAALARTVGERLRVQLADAFGIDTSTAAAPTTPPAAPSTVADVRADRTQPLPLSAAQRALWTLDRLQPGRTDYLVATVLRMRGPLDPAALARALTTVVARHEVLRTTYVDTGGEVNQIVRPAERVPLPVTDVDGAAGVTAVVSTELATPVDLARGPVLRARLLRDRATARPGRDTEHVLVLVCHHIATDGWSNGVIAAELAAAYAGTDLPPPRLQYADHAAAEAQRHAGGVLEVGLAYWERTLAGLQPAAPMPDRPRPAVRDARGASISFTVPPQLADAVRALGRAHATTPFVTCLAAVHALVARCTTVPDPTGTTTGRATDVAIGTPVAGRDDPAYTELVGYLVNPVVVRAGVLLRRPFTELLATVRAATLEAIAHADVPFDRVVDRVVHDRDLSRNPLFDVMFALREAGEERFDLPGLHVVPEPVPWGSAKVDLLVELTARPDGGYTGVVEYATSLYDEATASRFAAHYVRLLTAAAAGPGRAVGDLDLLDAAGTRALVHTWNDTAGPLGRCVPERIAQACARFPDAVAVVAPDEHLTYAQLDERVNRLAARLRILGAGPETVVAVCLPRRVDMVVAILAVHRAGAAYLPLEPTLPADRLAYMLDDSGARIVIADEPPVSGRDVLRPDDPAVVAASAEPVDVRIDRATLAYVIYTSGSTGRPKGVALPHHGIANQILWKIDGVGILPTDRVLLKTTITFDAAGWEIFAPLCIGATVVVAPPDVERDPTAMIETIAAHRVTVLQVVPSFLRPFADDAAVARAASLRMIYSAGEALPAEVCHRLATALPGTSVINGYGPTEASIEVTSYVYAAARDGRDGVVPIGRPGNNTRMSVLGPVGELVPLGVPGELQIAGESLARGYLGRPALTASVFVPDAYGPPGSRRYRTGDLARRRSDGVLEYLGRLDHQVKIRGIRVEPGEIETVLAQHPAVAEVVVTSPPGPEGQPWLVAYVVLRGSATAEELRRHVGEVLPEQYVPSVVVELAALPVAPSGKVDRGALPDPGTARTGSDGGTAPRSPTEEIVAVAWGEALGLVDVDVDVEADFFALGGHSLAAIRAAGRVAAATGVPVAVRDVFRHRSVAALAAWLDANAHDRRGPSADDGPCAGAAGAGPAPLSPAQQRLWFLHRLDPDAGDYHLTYALQVHGPLDGAALRTAITGLVDRHDILRTRYPEGLDGDPVQVVEATAPDLHVVDLTVASTTRIAAEDRAAALLVDTASRPFDLALAPPFRALVVRVAADEHLVALVLHHIAGDGATEPVLARELDELYAAAVAGREPQLPDQPLRFADVAVWERARRTPERLAADLDHWRARLDGAAPLELPTDRPRPARRDGRGATVEFPVPAAVAGPLVARGRARGATPFTTFAALVAAVLARHADTTDVCLGTPLSARTRPELEELVGFLVDTVVLRVDLSGAPGIDELVDRTAAAALEAFGHVYAPFERLVAELVPHRDPARNPLFDVMVEVVDEPTAPSALGGCRTRRLAVPRTAAKFDLSFTLTADGTGGYTGELEYATALFDADTAARIAGHLVTLAGSAADRRPVHRIDLRTPAEIARQAVRDAAGGADDDAGTVVAAVADRARRTPGAAAVVSVPGAASGPESVLTYAELHARAGVLAHALRSHGVGRDTPVAVLVERGPAAVVVWLAVLVAGGVYTPLDPAQPTGRTDLLLADLRPAAVVTGPGAAAPAGRSEPVLAVGAGGEPCDIGVARLVRVARLAGITTAAPEPADPAYLLYTSGSTGVPKGVVVGHAAYAHHCRVISETYDIRAGDRVLLLAALTFDVSLDQIGATLFAGATVVVGGTRLWEPRSLPDSLHAARVTHVEITPAHYRELLAHLGPGDRRLAGLRLMNVGSDVVTVRDADAWTATGLPGRFLHTYGPTEATVTATVHDATGVRATGGDGPLPIGIPVPGTGASVLDRYGLSVPDGVAGELYLAGPRVAIGYRGRPRATAAAFVPDPDGPPGARRYRTGDGARRRGDGTLEFLGRLDGQVKVRGYRIEPAEVEAALVTHPAVLAAAAAAPRLRTGERVLAGYVVPDPAVDPDRRPGPAELAAHLHVLLPAHLVPTHWVELAELPRTSSGKIDRAALPVPEPAPAAGRAPDGPVEEAIAALWAQALGVDEVGADEEFFAIGGHSLVATRLRTGLADLFDLDVPLRLVFEATTVAAQATACALLAEAAEPGTTPDGTEEDRR